MRLITSYCRLAAIFGLFPVAAAVAALAQLASGKVLPGPLPPGKAIVWVERGTPTPSQVYFGRGSEHPDPLSRVPAGPFSDLEKDLAGSRTNPKVKVKDSRGVRWTVKFGSEARSDIVAPRLAWALGFGSVECYSVPGGRVEGITEKTDLGRAGGRVKRDGTMLGPARFKRHDKDADEVQDGQHNDLTWDPARNPGVPPEHLSGLLLFDVLVCNWDAQPKNSKVLHVEGKDGPVNWFIESDLGATLAYRWWAKYDLERFRNAPPMVKQIDGQTVVLNFVDQAKREEQIHRRIPLAHAQWYRGLAAKLTDAQIRAAFDAAYATPALDQAYASGDVGTVAAARTREIPAASLAEIEGFVAAVRRRIADFLAAVPAAK